MRFLCSSSDLRDVLTELLENCEGARWAVAWAKKSALEFVPLEENWEKIAQLTVGTSFNHTDPEFISEYNGLPEVGFVTMSSGVFHPKVYYFEHGGGRWDCVVGSVNFTESAFSKNSEAAVRINQDDADAEGTRKKIIDELDRYQTLGKALTAEEIEKYLEGWRRKEEFLSEFTNTDPSPERPKKAHRSHDVPILNEGWNQYFREVKRGAKERQEHDLEEMLELLERAQKMFREHLRFSDIDKNGRRRIAGTVAKSLIEEDEPDWWCFGSMYPSGKFENAINVNNQGISDALDHIPLEGPVERADFDVFVDLFRSSFEKSGVGTATRLLAMKRPDYFVCLNKGNKESFCEKYGIPKSVNLDNYWPRVIERIQKTEWWDSPQPPRGIERRVWRCRVAMLDAIYWSPGTGG